MKLSILTDLFSACWWWLFFWMLAAFILGWILRKLFGGNSNDENCCDEYEALKRRYSGLEKKYNQFLAKSNKRIETVPKPNVANKLSVVGTTKSVVKAKQRTSKKRQTNAFSKLKKNNLQVVEGIGPKMDALLKKNGITNWADLSTKTFDELRGLLDKENPTRYKIINPTTWPEQAGLAAKGKFEELILLQKDLDTGKTNTLGNTDSKLEKIMLRLGLLKKWKQDDLKAVEGIGPKIAALFIDNGINTWKALSEASVDSLKAVLEKGGSRYKLANPGTWGQQAKLADEGKWEELQKLQDELDGGK